MMTKGMNYRRIRLILDCILLLAAVLLVIVNYHPIQANTEPHPSTQAIPTESSQELSAQSQASGMADVTQAITNSVTLDDNTLAALMAAENAALTAPQFLTGLPIITR
jgi:hypothetical protein